LAETKDRQPIHEHSRLAPGKAVQFDSFFRALTKAGGSDLHLKAGRPPYVRINTSMRPTKGEPLSSEKIEEMAMELMTDKQHKYFSDHGAIDLACEIPGGDRFRINIYRQRGNVSVSVRRVTRNIRDFEDLHLPASVRTIAEAHQGLVLLSGPTGCGKSTTIAAMLQYINRTRACHIVTIEDPIEYLYEDEKALVNQREIGIDVESFDSALRYLMREDPDVVLIGEMRDYETFQAALQASETGHLVFGTVHASSAPQTIGRILDLFPPEGRDRVRQSLADNLQAIICQKLLPCIAKDVDRIPAVEILIRNPSVRQLISEDRQSELAEVIRSHERDGMLSFTRSLLDLIERNLVDPRVAYEVAPNVDELKMLMKGISSSRTGLLGR